MSSKEHELQDFHDLMEEINAQFVALIDRFSIPEDLQRKIDSIARYLLNVIYPLLDPDTYFRLVELMNLFLHCQNYSREGPRSMLRSPGMAVFCQWLRSFYGGSKRN